MPTPVFRFAPSPNGELHLGHAYSALLNAKLANEAGGKFLVRIEDIDTVRCTREFAVQALSDLRWLGLTWEEPVRFLSEHLRDYGARQDVLRGSGLLYPCFCSRKDIAARHMPAVLDPEGQPLYDGHCRFLSDGDISELTQSGVAFSLRLDMREAVARSGGGLAMNPGPWGDVILVRKDILTSYHMAVVTDDALQGITHVVRGRDLEQSTSIHLLLQRLLALPHPVYRHHELISDDSGRKLAKSLHSTALSTLREEGTTAGDIRKALGFD